MASKQTLIFELHKHHTDGVALYCEWGAKTDEKPARTCHAKERDEWTPGLKDLIREINPALWVNYETVTPFKKPRSAPAVFEQWDDMAAGFMVTAERLDLLKSDVEKLARDNNVDLTAPLGPVVRFAPGEAKPAYAEHVKAGKEKTGHAPTIKEDIAWGKQHGLPRERIRAFRRGPARTEKDRQGGNPT